MFRISANCILLMLLLIKTCLGGDVMVASPVIVIDFKDDTIRINNLNLISKNTSSTDPEKAMVYARQAHQLASKIGFKKGSAYALKNIGIAFYIQGKYSETIKYWQESL